MDKLPIDWAAVDWVNVTILSAFVFFAAFLGHMLALSNRLFGSLLAAILFGAFYIAWIYYLRDLVGTSLARPA